ncbi:MAG: efflux transporter outer membrane subunit [Desulfovibrionales bacterium]|nr:efflux transporter outer membrane subunit [Desulfovibrionales bacterium]
MRNLVLAFMLALLGAGCTLGPDYVRPNLDMPAAWRIEAGEANNLADTAWWGQFGDPVLSGLIDTALRENKDLLIATARIEEFEGRYGIVRADLFPQVGAGASYSRDQITREAENKPAEGYATLTETYSTTLNAAWEIDLWGRIRRSTEAARAQLLGTEEARRGVILSLVGNVAAAYVNLRGLDRQLEIARNTVRSREGSYRIFQERYDGGIISLLELTQNKSQYEEAMAIIPPIEKAIAQQENGLSVLLGRNPGPIPRGLPIEELTLPAVVAGLPSDLLERRPDVRQAEQALVAANAQIGVAKAAYFPAISLTGLFGFASADLKDLFRDSAQAWSYSAPVTVPIFTAGRIAGNVKAAEAIQRQALAGYRQAVQNAFREVNDALTDQQQTGRQLDAQDKQVASLRQYDEVARLRYDEGYTDFLTVLDAERSLFNAELSFTQTRVALHRAMIGLYKAMGGGWMNTVEQSAATRAQ